jgi:hypothetical protein
LGFVLCLFNGCWGCWGFCLFVCLFVCLCACVCVCARALHTCICMSVLQQRVPSECTGIIHHVSACIQYR